MTFTWRTVPVCQLEGPRKSNKKNVLFWAERWLEIANHKDWIIMLRIIYTFAHDIFNIYRQTLFPASFHLSFGCKRCLINVFLEIGNLDNLTSGILFPAPGARPIHQGRFSRRDMNMERHVHEYKPVLELRFSDRFSENWHLLMPVPSAADSGTWKLRWSRWSLEYTSKIDCVRVCKNPRCFLIFWLIVWEQTCTTLLTLSKNKIK